MFPLPFIDVTADLLADAVWGEPEFSIIASTKVNRDDLPWFTASPFQLWSAAVGLEVRAVGTTARSGSAVQRVADFAQQEDLFFDFLFPF